MTGHAARELLLDSEATLRMAMAAAGDAARAADLAGIGPAPTHDAADAAAVPLSALPELILRVYREIDSMVERLRESRGALRRAAVEKLQHTSEKLRLVTSATEVAATDIMDSVDRALGLVDDLENRADGDVSDEANALRAAIRDELFAVMTHLQFQDITTQQISHASAMLDDMEQRLATLSQVFDPRTLGFPVDDEPAVASTTFDPQASTEGQPERQALVDEIFGGS